MIFFFYKHILFQKKVFALKAQTAYREDSHMKYIDIKLYKHIRLLFKENKYIRTSQKDTSTYHKIIYYTTKII
jgi:hypothetical protein